MHEQGRSIEELSRQVSRLQLAVKHHDVALQQQKEIMELKSEENLKNSEEMHRRELVSGYRHLPITCKTIPYLLPLTHTQKTIPYLLSCNTYLPLLTLAISIAG